MGNEVFYCSACGGKLLTTDFTRGRAFTVERRSFCSSCMAKPLAAPPPPVKRPATGRTAVPARAAPLPSWPTGTAAAAVVALVAIVIWIAAPTSTPVAEPRAGDPRELSARRLVAAAEAFTREHPVDLTGQSARWREALRAAEGTPLADGARLASERVEQLRKEAFKIELTRMEEALRASLAREEFQEALKAVEEAKQKAPSPEDGLALDRRAQEIRDQAKALVPAVVKEATAAARSADPSLMKTLRERIFRWGLPDQAGQVKRELDVRYHRLPAAWKGVSIGKADGNPAKVDSDAAWTLYQVWPDDPMKADHYRLLAWDGKLWKALSDTHAEAPGAECSQFEASLIFKGAWTNLPGYKIPALSFTAPALGTYIAEGKLDLDIWEGSPPIKILILKLDRSSKIVQVVSEVNLDAPRKMVPFKVEARLDRGQELAIAVRAEKYHVAGTVTIKQLVVFRSAD